MNELFKLGISTLEVQNMVEMNEEIHQLSEAEIISKIQLLQQINCTLPQIRNILISNPFYLSFTTVEIQKIIQNLLKLGFTNLNLLFDSNPFFFDYEVEELKEYIINKQQYGMLLEDIISMIQDNPYIEM